VTNRARRLLGFGVAVLWSLLTGWIFVFGSTLGAVGIDVGSSPIGGWLQLAGVAAVGSLIAFWWWPTMVASAIAALVLVFEVIGSMTGSSPDVLSGLEPIVQLGAIVAASSAVAGVSGFREWFRPDAVAKA